jgi:hypothetical protein
MSGYAGYNWFFGDGQLIAYSHNSQWLVRVRGDAEFSAARPRKYRVSLVERATGREVKFTTWHWLPNAVKQGESWLEDSDQ